MDIYEFSQVLWRRRWLLVSGFALLLIFVVALSVDFSDGVKLRSNPKYEAAVQMAVIPEGYDSLGQDLGPNSLSGTAQLFTSLLSSPQAALEIAEREGVNILDLTVATTGRDRFLTAKIISDSPGSASIAALGAFSWLEQRLSLPLLTASVPEDPSATSTPVDANGEFRGTVRLEADHSLAVDSEGLWLITSTEAGDSFAYRLADAVDSEPVLFTAAVTPGRELSFVLEDAEGRALDTVIAPVPLLPADGGSAYELIVELQRGLIRGAAGDPQLAAPSLNVAWSRSDLIGDSAIATDGSAVGILLLTDTPVPERIGGRKTPLLIVAMLTAGTIAIVVLVVVVDSWRIERERRQKAEVDVVLGTLSRSNESGTDEEQLRRISS